MKKFICLILCILFAISNLFTQNPYFPSGNGAGTAGNPYRITTVSELISLRNLVNEANEAYNAACYILTADLDLSGLEWIPIGTVLPFTGSSKLDEDAILFKGVFDGNGKMISNLTIDNREYGQGLFGAVKYAVIKNLTMRNVQLRANSYSGGLIGLASVSTIENCHVSGKIDCFFQSGSSAGIIGGIVGKAEKNEAREKNSIRNCSNTADVSVTTSGAGGIVGQISASYGSNEIINCTNTGTIFSYHGGLGGITGFANNTDITNCRNTGNVTGQGRCGGIAGDFYGNMKNCSNSGNIKTESSEWPDVSVEHSGGGGIVGQSRLSTIVGCRNTGSVSSSQFARIGGIVGFAPYSVTIQDCRNEGRVTGLDFTGGISGRIGGGATGGSGGCNVYGCYNTGDVTGKNVVGGVLGCLDIDSSMLNSYNIGFVRGEALTGGLVGGIDNRFTISACYSTGNVAATGSRAGGLVGGSIADISASASGTETVRAITQGSISNCYVTGTVEGADYVGGIAGEIPEDVIISNCAALNNSVTATTGSNAGRISSSANDYFENNFAWESMSGVTGSENNSDSKDGTGKTKNELREASTWASLLGEGESWAYASGFLPIITQIEATQSGNWPDYLLNQSDKKYTLNITNGHGEGEYLAGALVQVLAQEAEAGKSFREWTAEGITLTTEQKSSSSLIFTMPAGNVRLTAAYSEITGLEKVENTETVFIYPNPATSGFYVQGIGNNVELRIYSLNGNTAISRQINSGEYISADALLPGIYIIKLINENKTISLKLIKK